MPGVCAGRSRREFALGVPLVTKVCTGSAGSSRRERRVCRELAPGVPGVHAGSASRDVVPRVCSGSYTVPSRGSGFVLQFVLFALFAASVQFDPGVDSVRTGLPVLVSSHAGDCGRLLLILLCCCLVELCLSLWYTSRITPTPLGPVYRTPGHAHPDCKTAHDIVTVSLAAEASVYAHAMAWVIKAGCRSPRPRVPDAFMSTALVWLVAGYFPVGPG